MSGIKAVTFDLWDTVFADDSDEPKRARAGLPTKKVERRSLVHQALSRHQPISRERVDTAYDAVDAAFNRVWKVHQVTWTVRERLAVLLEGLSRTLPDPELAELVLLHEDMELRHKPDLAPGIAEALSALHGRYRLGVISDAIFSPGRALRELLAHYDLARFFDAMIFSDEQGCSKPKGEVFLAAARALGVDVTEIVHLGDREQNDIVGPKQAGARAILCTPVKDRRVGPSQADAICTDYAELPALVDRLNQTST